MNPLEMNGPEFLKLFGLAIAAASVLTIVYRLSFSLAKSYSDDTKLPELDPWQLAYLRSGTKAVAQTAIIDLAAKKLIVGDPVSGRFVVSKNVDQVRMEPIPNALYRATQMGEGMKAERATEAIRYECEKIKQSLIELGVLQTFEQRIGLTWPGILAFSAVLVLGGAKFVVGVSRGKPVGYLLLMILLAVALAVIFNYSTQLTRAGKLALEKEIRKIRAAQSNPQSDSGNTASSSFANEMLLYSMHPLAIGFAAGGFGGMYGDEMLDANTRKLTERMHANGTTGGDATGGGCGSADSGASDGGSGCGGGGCGGCGS